MDCLGHERRVEITKNYHLKPIAHTRLLNGYQLSSCTGRLLTDSYYSFRYESKTDKSDTGTFYCGKPTGEDFMKLLDLQPLGMFNPLSASPSGNYITSTQNTNTNLTWNPVAKELFTAINLLIIYWGNRPLTGFLADFLLDLRKYYYSEPYLNRIKSINTILKNINCNLSGILAQLMNNNPTIRQFTFHNLDNKIKQTGEVSFFN